MQRLRTLADMTVDGPKIEAVRALRQALGDSIWTTPLLRCAGIELALDNDTRVWGKLEFLQRTGTFKARGALANLHALAREQLDRGVTAVSAGNHAIATAFAARALGSTAKVVMIGTANPYRINARKSYGAKVILVDDVHEAFEVAKSIEREEGRFFVHPFEGPEVAAGALVAGLLPEQAARANTVNRVARPRTIERMRGNLRAGRCARR